LHEVLSITLTTGAAVVHEQEAALDAQDNADLATKKSRQILD
jgi:hypothetical protein